MIGAAILLAANFALNKPVDCQAIPDNNKRAECYAKTRQDIGACGAISDFYLRAACRSEISGQKDCDAIPDLSKRAECKA